MRSKMFFALAALLFAAGVVFGWNPHHFVAAGFCLFGGFFAFVRAVVTIGDGDKVDEQHHQKGF